MLKKSNCSSSQALTWLTLLTCFGCCDLFCRGGARGGVKQQNKSISSNQVNEVHKFTEREPGDFDFFNVVFGDFGQVLKKLEPENCEHYEYMLTHINLSTLFALLLKGSIKSCELAVSFCELCFFKVHSQNPLTFGNQWRLHE